MLVSRFVYIEACALGTHLWVVVGGLGDGVVHAVKRALDYQGAQHGVREGVVRAIDARVLLCACHAVSTWCTSLGGSWRYLRNIRPMW